MQDLTPEICKGVATATTTTGNNYQLVDDRDGKVYYVAKLADGNCWMTQNLDYDGGGTRITSTNGSNSGPSTDWKDDNNIAQYWDPGEKIVSGNTLAAATSSTDRHLLVGNHYSWLAATNNSGYGMTAGAASESICPSGWKLPTSNSTTNNSSFGKLTTAYNANFTTIQQPPLSFVAGGVVNSGALSYTGVGSYYWSSTASGGTDAYNLNFNSGSVNPSNSSNRYPGVSVRCLVQGS